MLIGQKCEACNSLTPHLTKAQIEDYMAEAPGWTLSEDGLRISRKEKFKNFAEALAFVNRIGDLAEAEGHHPDLELGWGRVGTSLTTHAIKSLSKNDFIMAAKINALLG